LIAISGLFATGAIGAHSWPPPSALMSAKYRKITALVVRGDTSPPGASGEGAAAPRLWISALSDLVALRDRKGTLLHGRISLK
jgi:hypothetical protein